MFHLQRSITIQTLFHCSVYSFHVIQRTSRDIIRNSLKTIVNVNVFLVLLHDNTTRKKFSFFKTQRVSVADGTNTYADFVLFFYYFITKLFRTDYYCSKRRADAQQIFLIFFFSRFLPFPILVYEYVRCGRVRLVNCVRFSHGSGAGQDDFSTIRV